MKIFSQSTSPQDPNDTLICSASSTPFQYLSYMGLHEIGGKPYFPHVGLGTVEVSIGYHFNMQKSLFHFFSHNIQNTKILSLNIT